MVTTKQTRVGTLSLPLRALACAAALFASACSEEAAKPRTQLVLVAGTDISSLRTVHFEVSQGDKNKSSSGEVSVDTPAFVSLLYQSGSLGPVDIVAEGLDGQGEFVVSRRARVSFVRNETRVVALHLLATCIAEQASCDQETETCGEEGCGAVMLEASDLEKWDGTPPKPDTSPPDMDASMPEDAGNDAGDGGDSDAGSMVDAGGCDAASIDFNTDEAHCGGCNIACDRAGPNQVPICENGVCTYPCEDATRWADCTIAPGCESDLTDDLTCGSCTNKCKGTTRQCVDKMCVP